MKHTLFILALITASIQTFAQSPRIKLNQITKDSITGSVLISSPTDSGMVYSRDLFVSYGADTFLILGGDTLAATSGIISSVLSDGVTITGDGTTGSELTVDTATVIATKGDLSDYVTIAGTETITGAKTFSSTVTGTRFDPTSSSTTGNGMFLPTTNTLGFSTNGVEKARITTLGSLGLNTIPKNNWSGTTSIEIGANAVIYSENDESIYNSYTTGINFYLDSLANFKYKNTNPAPARMGMFQGTFLFDNAAAGTQDSIITWTRRMTLTDIGRLGIATNNPAYTLDVDGDINASGEVRNSGVILTSDSRYKKNINPILNGIEKINLLNPVSYYWNDVMLKKLHNSQSKIKENIKYGLIAQEVELNFPEFVSEGEDGFKSIDYQAIITLIIASEKEQQTIIESQATEIETLKTLITDLSNRLQILENN